MSEDRHGAFLMMLFGAECYHCGQRAYPAHIGRRGKFRWCAERRRHHRQTRRAHRRDRRRRG